MENLTIAIIIVLILVLLFWFTKSQTTNEEGFDTLPNKLVLFYVPWCGYCKKFMPTWEKLPKTNLPVHFKMVNCEKEKDLCKRYQIKSYPTLILIKPNEIIPFKGDRSFENITAFINKHVPI